MRSSGLTGPCTYGNPPCGQEDAHPYAEGPRCDDHTPAARAGQPEPGSARYCVRDCRCSLHGDLAPLPPIRATVIDARVIASGKRRASLAEYRDAQARTRR